MTAALVASVRLPLKIVSTANVREHWRKRAERTRLHRHTALLLLARGGQAPSFASAVVTLTRIAPRPLDDDNLAGGFKAARDGVADWLKRDDGDGAITWRYQQRRGSVREYAAEVQIVMEL